MKQKIIKAYKVDKNVFGWNIIEVDIDKSLVNNQPPYFKTFGAAKKYTVGYLKDMIAQYKNNLVEIKKLKQTK